jgi:predicted PurR-regulated permease PerM
MWIMSILNGILAAFVGALAWFGAWVTGVADPMAAAVVVFIIVYVVLSWRVLTGRDQ